VDLTIEDIAAFESRRLYGLEKFPSPRDDEIRAVIGRIQDSADYRSLRSALLPVAWEMFDAFALRMASLAVRDRDLGVIRDGLVALQLAFDLTDDFREVIAPLMLLHRAIEMIGGDPAREFAAVFEISGERNEIMARFLNVQPGAQEDRVDALRGGRRRDGLSIRQFQWLVVSGRPTCVRVGVSV